VYLLNQTFVSVRSLNKRLYFDLRDCTIAHHTTRISLNRMSRI